MATGTNVREHFHHYRGRHVFFCPFPFVNFYRGLNSCSDFPVDNVHYSVILADLEAIIGNRKAYPPVCSEQSSAVAATYVVISGDNCLFEVAHGVLFLRLFVVCCFYNCAFTEKQQHRSFKTGWCDLPLAPSIWKQLCRHLLYNSDSFDGNGRFSVSHSLYSVTHSASMFLLYKI